jgi:hypothetical protein
VGGFSPLAAGLYAVPAGLTQFAVANLAKPLVARYGFRPVLTAGLLGSAAGLGVLATSTASSPVCWFEVGVAARYAYAAGLDLGMMVGAGCAVAAAVVVCLGLRARRRLPSDGPVPAPDGQTTPSSERLVRGSGR